VVDLGDRRLVKVLRHNLGRFRELLSSKSVPVARQALRRLLGDEVFLFTPRPDGRYELHAETRLGTLFDGCSEIIGAGGGLRKRTQHFDVIAFRRIEAVTYSHTYPTAVRRRAQLRVSRSS
jgi:hypothetical protein